MNLIDVTIQFAIDEQCLAYLEAMRWPDGVRCPVCGNDKISKISRRTASKNKCAQIYQCLEKTCNQQFSAASARFFSDSHLPLKHGSQLVWTPAQAALAAPAVPHSAARSDFSPLSRNPSTDCSVYSPCPQSVA